MLSNQRLRTIMVKILMCSEKANVERLSVLKNDYMFYRGDIMGKVRMSKADRWRKRPCVMKYWEFKDRLVAQAKEQKFELGNILHMEFIIEMPKSWSKKKKEAMFMKPHQNKPDIDNIVKGLMDALKDSDSDVWHTHHSMSESHKNPRRSQETTWGSVRRLALWYRGHTQNPQAGLRSQQTCQELSDRQAVL